jgi:hypothetical protein
MESSSEMELLKRIPHMGILSTTFCEGQLRVVVGKETIIKSVS